MRLPEIEQREFTRYLNSFDFSSYMRDKRILITGSKGIVGSGLIKWLLMENELHHANVRIYASTREPKRLPDYIEADDRITYVAFGHEEACGPVDAMIHAAAPTSKRFFISQPVEAMLVIQEGTRKMLDLAAKYHAEMVYLSSEEAYGLPRSEEPIDESYVGAIDSLNIRNCYPLGKKAAELLCVSYAAEYGTDVKILRPTVIQGLLQPYENDKVENQILQCVLENKDFVMKSAGTTKKSMIYSLDAVCAVLTVLFKGQRAEAYNATNPQTYMSVKELAATVFERFCPALKVITAAQDAAEKEGYLPTRTMRQRIDKIQRLGWSPLTNLDQIYQVDLERFRASKNSLR